MHSQKLQFPNQIKFDKFKVKDAQFVFIRVYISISSEIIQIFPFLLWKQ